MREVADTFYYAVGLLCCFTWASLVVSALVDAVRKWLRGKWK